MAGIRPSGRRSIPRAAVRRLLQWLPRFRDARVLVVGDLIVDEFIWGSVDRISPEAPVPVVRVTNRSLRWGGAANVANNLRAMGARVMLAGAVGNDEAGRWLLRDLRRKGLSTDGIQRDSGRASTLKTRIIAHNQQVVRIDREVLAALPEDQAERLRHYVRTNAAHVDALIVSDYGKGVVDDGLMEEVRAAVRSHGLIACVDPKVSPFSIYRGVTAVTPNHREAARAAEPHVKAGASLEEIGRSLLRELDCRMLLITRGEEGMSLFLDGDHHVHIPTVAREVYDVTGAGDTVISLFTLGLCVGAPATDAALLANLAAGIVVGEVGTATVSHRRLERTLREAERLSTSAG